MPDKGTTRLATKEEVLKNIKKAYNQHKLSYKEYMLEVKRTEKYYDSWKTALEESVNKQNEEIDMTNEELAIGQRLTDLQSKKTTIQEQEEKYEDVKENEE